MSGSARESGTPPRNSIVGLAGSWIALSLVAAVWIHLETTYPLAFAKYALLISAAVAAGVILKRWPSRFNSTLTWSATTAILIFFTVTR